MPALKVKAREVTPPPVLVCSSPPSQRRHRFYRSDEEEEEEEKEEGGATRGHSPRYQYSGHLRDGEDGPYEAAS